MELWIRSQDGKLLTQVKSVGVYQNHFGKGFDIGCGFSTYATYKKEARALQVLDEIQNAMLLSGLSNEETKVSNLEIKSWFATNSKTCLGIYQMPKE